MTIESIEVYFPYIVFVYGAILFFVLTNPKLEKIASDRLPHGSWGYLKSHQPIAAISVIVGGMWILQRIWLS